MKFSYALIKKLAPKAPPIGKLADGLNAHAFEVERFAGDLLDINLPANRYSDAASHIGIAREAAAIFSARGVRLRPIRLWRRSAFGGGLRLKDPVRTIVNQPSGHGLITVTVENPKRCPRYAARVFDIPAIKPSPAWMQKVLTTCGLKPVSGIVDLMNYVMLETGQPLHAFDHDRIADSRGPHADRRGKSRRQSASGPHKSASIVVRRAKKGERFETLDDQQCVLEPDDLVIADTKKALAIAGVKGGKNSGIERGTKRIVVEAANFSGPGIYRTSRRLKLPTDAAVRFMHNVSPALVDHGLDRATELLVGMGATLIDSADVYPKPAGDEVIEFDPGRYERLIGAPIAPAQARKYFQSLGFSVENADQRGLHADRRGKGLRESASGQRKSAFLVRVPAWRTDIETPEDLIEEAARLFGYNALPSEPPAVSIRPAVEDDAIILKDRARTLLAGYRVDELVSSSFLGTADLAGHEPTDGMFGAPERIVEVENPIAEDKRYLRPSVLPLLLAAVRRNSRSFDVVRLFEIGKVFSRAKSGVDEELALGIVLAAKDEPKLIFELKGLVDGFLKSLGLEEFFIAEQDGRLRIEVDHAVLGNLRLVRLERRWVAAAGELNLNKVLALAEGEREYRPLPKYPAVVRDVSFLVGRDVRIGDILAAIQEASPAIVGDVDLTDEYMDEKLSSPPSPDGSGRASKQSLTFRIVFQAEDRTLTDAEVNREFRKIVTAVREKFRAGVR
jgi:phenylalanyl-tRNA synthetase beta chain